MHSQFPLLRHTGKPIGFWYAYGQDWKNYINKNNDDEKKSGRSKENTSYRYEFTIPESAFVKNIKEASLHTILELSKSNLDEFMRIFYDKNDSLIGSNHLIEQSLDNYRLYNKSLIIEELLSKSEEFKVFLNEKLSSKKKASVKSIIKEANTKFPKFLSTYFPSIQAQKEYGGTIYLWSDFWMKVGNLFGGVEFHNDLFDIESWEDIWLPWTSVISIRSGVIFHSTSFLDGILSKQLKAHTMEGGKKRQYTRRKRRSIKKTKRRYHKQ
jgi:hypothetical protein